MDALALLVYRHCLDKLHIDETQLTEEMFEKYRACCNIIVRVNRQSSFDQMCDQCTKAMQWLAENPTLNLPAAAFTID